MVFPMIQKVGTSLPQLKVTALVEREVNQFLQSRTETEHSWEVGQLQPVFRVAVVTACPDTRVLSVWACPTRGT